MNKTKRLYSTLNLRTGTMQWYFKAREGQAGPYDTKAHALRRLHSFTEMCLRQGETGGRQHPTEAKSVQNHQGHGAAPLTEWTATL